MIISGAATVALIVVLTAPPGYAEDKINKDEAFKPGQSMTECASFFTAMERSGIWADKPASVELMKNKATAGGWPA